MALTVLVRKINFKQGLNVKIAGAVFQTIKDSPQKKKQ